MEKAKIEINEICNQGYVPVGMEVEDGAVILVMYTRSPEKMFTTWAIVAMGDLSTEKVKKDFADMLKVGWLPVAFSFTKSGYYILFLRTGSVVEGVRMANGAESIEAIENNLTAFGNKDFYPYGMTWFNGKLWYLFLKIPTTMVSEMIVRRYKNIDEALGEGIKGEVEKGFIPWDISISPGWVYIIYGK